MKIAIAALSSVMGFAASLAQSFNIDFGAPASAPSSTYAAAGLPGVWNTFEIVPAYERRPLVGLDGSATTARYYQAGITSMLSFDNPDTQGDDQALLDDMALSANNPVDACVWIEGLRPGRYEVLIYALTPNDPILLNRCRVDDAFTGPVFIGGAWIGEHKEGISFSRHTVLLTGSYIGLHAGLYGMNAQSGMNGIQLKHFGEPAMVVPSTVSAFRGSVTSGGVAEVANSDELKLLGRPGPVLFSSEMPLQLIFEATSPTETPFRWTLRIESSATITNLAQTASMWDFVHGVWVDRNVRTLSTGDSTVDIQELTDLARFVEPGTRKIKLRLGFKPSGATLLFPWTARIDQVRWVVTP